MSFYKWHVKLMLAKATPPPAQALIVPVFHRIIRERLIDDVLIDVVDYSHVHHGPGVCLIGHHHDYSMDEEGGEPGLLVARKRGPDDADALAALSALLRRAREVAALLSSDATLGLPAFRDDCLLVRLNDRRVAPNTADMRAHYVPIVQAALAAAYPNNSTLRLTPAISEGLRFEVRAETVARV